MNLLRRLLKVAALRVLISAVGLVLALAVAIITAYRRGIAPPVLAPPRTPSAPSVAVATLPREEKPTPVVYQSKGRRDPFRPPQVEAALSEPPLNIKVTGIVRGPRSYYALVESEVQEGKGWVIREHDIVDSARVLKITKDAVIFEVKAKTAEGKPLTRLVPKRIGP